MTTMSPEEEGETTFGGISVSLAPIDLANIFVQVQQIVGMNCTCAEGMGTEEMITNTTMRLLNESLEEAKRMRLYSSLDSSSYSSLNDEQPKKGGGRSRAPKRGKLSEKKKTKKGGGRKKMWQPRSPKSLN